MRVNDVVAMIRNRSRREEIYSTAEYWDSKADAYSDSSASMWRNTILNAHYETEQTDWLLKRITPVSGLNILDLGCGTGRLSRFLADRGAQVLGIDFAAKAVDIARRLSTGSNPAYRVQSVYDLRERETFDVILTWGVLTVACRNEEQLLLALARIHRALKVGGKAIFFEPVHKGFLHRVLNLELRTFLLAMSTAGFDVKETTHLHFWPVRLALAYIPWPKLITTPLYFAGQTVLTLLGRKSMGDYQGIVGMKRET
jgi:2-polyprenyl-3-methyl-5-hydroxy-6-metoxy-1,4-benzoquinol methylase